MASEEIKTTFNWSTIHYTWLKQRAYVSPVYLYGRQYILHLQQ